MNFERIHPNELQRCEHSEAPFQIGVAVSEESSWIGGWHALISQDAWDNASAARTRDLHEENLPTSFHAATLDKLS